MEFKIGDKLVFETSGYHDGPILEFYKTIDQVMKIDECYIYGDKVWFDRLAGIWYIVRSNTSDYFNYLTSVWRKNEAGELEKVWSSK